jgi:DNA-binding response OmpR family regulator
MSNLPNRQDVRILVADDEQLLSGKLVEFLNEKGFNVRFVQTGFEVMRTMQLWKPDFLIVDLMLPEANALELLKTCNAAGLMGEDKLKVIVVSGHKSQQNIRECMRLGAVDFLVKPLKHSDIISRIVLMLQKKHELSDRASDQVESAQYFVHLTDLILRETLKSAPPDETLHNLTGLLGVSMKAVRVSVIRTDFDGRRGWVTASNDKRTINNLEIDLVKYPEILYVLRNDKLLALDNLVADPAMHFVTRQQKEIQFNSMIVCPIRHGNITWGVVSIRMADNKEKLTDLEIRYAQLVSNVIALVVLNSPSHMTALPALPQSA